MSSNPRTEFVVALTQEGKVKRLPLSDFPLQHRGGKGVVGSKVKETDVLRSLYAAREGDIVLVFTNRQLCHRLPVSEFPEMSRYAGGKDISKLLGFEEGETVSALWVGDESALSGGYLVFASERGDIKRTSADEFARMRKSAVKATRVEEGDRLVGIVHSGGSAQVVLATRQGKAARFAEEDVRPSGRAAGGVRGITLADGDALSGIALAEPGDLVFTVTAFGYGKRSPLDDYRLSARGARGVANVSDVGKTGPVIAVLRAAEGDQVLLSSAHGKTIRFSISEVREVGRASAGVRAMDLEEGDMVAAALSVTAPAGELPVPEAPKAPEA